MFFLVVLLLAVGSVQTTTFYRFYEKQHFGEFKGIAEKFATWNSQFGKENVSNAVVVNAPFYIHYYLDEMNPGIEFLQYDNRGSEELKALSQMLDSVRTPYFVYGWTKPAPLEIELMLNDKYPCIADQAEFADLSKVTLFSSKPIDSCLQGVQPDYIFENYFDDEFASINLNKNLDSLLFKSKPFSLKVDSLSEFTPGYKTRVGDVPCGEFIKIEFSAEVYSEEEIENAIIVLTLRNSETEYLWHPSQIQNFAIPGKWKSCFMAHFFKEIKSADDILNIYIWNKSRSTFYMDNVKVKFFKDHSEASLK